MVYRGISLHHQSKEYPKADISGENPDISHRQYPVRGVNTMQFAEYTGTDCPMRKKQVGAGIGEGRGIPANEPPLSQWRDVSSKYIIYGPLITS